MIKLIIFFTCAFLSAQVFAYSVVYKNIHECDIQAAHPGDKNHFAKGVHDNDIIVNPAIIACDSALRNHSTEARFYFQIGRAYLMKETELSDKHAFVAFKNGAKLGYAPAKAYLGVMYETGRSVNKDEALAAKLYENAYNEGFDLAAIFLNDLNGLLIDFDISMYKMPNLMYWLYKKEFDNIPDNAESRLLLLSVHKAFLNLCAQYEASYMDINVEKSLFGFTMPILLTNIDKVILKLPEVIKRVNLSGSTIPVDLSVSDLITSSSKFYDAVFPLLDAVAMLRVDGISDGKLFFAQNSCSGHVADQFIDGLKTYFEQRSNVKPKQYLSGDNDGLYRNDY